MLEAPWLCPSPSPGIQRKPKTVAEQLSWPPSEPRLLPGSSRERQHAARLWQLDRTAALWAMLLPKPLGLFPWGVEGWSQVSCFTPSSAEIFTCLGVVRSVSPQPWRKCIATSCSFFHETKHGIKEMRSSARPPSGSERVSSAYFDYILKFSLHTIGVQLINSTPYCQVGFEWLCMSSSVFRQNNIYRPNRSLPFYWRNHRTWLFPLVFRQLLFRW